MPVSDFFKTVQFPPCPDPPPLPKDVEDLSEGFWSKVAWPQLPWALPALMRPREIQELFYRAVDPGTPDGEVIEIGSGWGGSFYALHCGNMIRNTSHNRENHVFTVEPFPMDNPSESMRMSMVCTVAAKEKYTHVLTGYHDVIPVTFGDRQCFRVALVDGDHEGPWCRRDCDTVVPRIMAGGILLVHDVGFAPGPNEVGRELNSGSYAGRKITILYHADSLLVARVDD